MIISCIVIIAIECFCAQSLHILKIILQCHRPVKIKTAFTTEARIIRIDFCYRVRLIGEVRILRRIFCIPIKIWTGRWAIGPRLFVYTPDVRIWLVFLVLIATQRYGGFEPICNTGINIGTEIPTVIIHRVTFVTTHLLGITHIEEIINLLRTTIQ